MEFLVPLMPLLGTLPIAVAAIVIARMWFRHRESQGRLAQRVDAIEEQLEALRLGQGELQERSEFVERVLQQVREANRLGP
ncbi:MAG: hypothetical protein AB7I33_07340 [Gemmatimonadales bacterium]